MANASPASRPKVGIALMLEPEFAQAAYPLFCAGDVETVEWSFDVLWSGDTGPDWLDDLLQQYSDAGQLLGHGVSYSMFTAGGDDRVLAWCERLREECSRLRFQHVTEHFGFMLAGDFHRGAPLPVPYTPELLRVGRDRLKCLADHAGVLVGLENLAFAFCPEDVKRQGEFLDALLEPVSGFLLLDLHNIYCQSCNFGISPEELLKSYPVSRARELHLSGGSWSEAMAETVRRDTHDGPVPEELFPLLEHTLSVCPNVTAVIFEQLGTALHGDASQKRYRSDFRRIAQTVNAHARR